MMGKTYKIKQTSKQNKGKFFYTSGYFMKKLAFYVVDRFEKKIFSIKLSKNSKTSCLYNKFSKKSPFLAPKNLLWSCFLVILTRIKHYIQFFSVISVVPIGIDPFLDLNGQNSNFENYKFISDPFYIRVNDWLATAEPSMDIFGHFLWVSPGQNGSLFLN